MKRLLYITRLAILLSSILFTKCSSDVDNIPNYPTLQFVSGEKYYTPPTDSASIGDTIILKWNFTTTSNMKYLLIEDKGATSSTIYYFKTLSDAVITKTTLTIPSAMIHSYSDTFSIKAISPGTATLRFTITDSLNNVISLTDVPIKMRSNYSYWTRRILYLPDSVEAHSGNHADAKCYLAIAKGTVYTYNNIISNPNLLNSLDLGFNSYIVTKTSGTITTSTRYHAFYSLTSNMYSKNDLTNLGSGIAPSRITYIKKLASTTESLIRNAADIKAAIGSSIVSTKDSTSDIKYPFGFKTVEGKYGIIWITNFFGDSLRLNIKVQN